MHCPIQKTCFALTSLKMQVQVTVYDYLLELVNAKVAVYSFARLLTEVCEQNNLSWLCTCMMSTFLLALLDSDRQCTLVPETLRGGAKSNFPIGIV